VAGVTAVTGRSGRTGTRRSEASAERLHHAVKRLRARLRSESGTHATGLTPTQRAVLATVVGQGPLTAARIADLEHVSPQSIAQSLAELKARGLVRPEPDPQDGRKKLIYAEASASELVDSLMAERSSFLVRAIDQVIAPGEREDLEKAIDLLERLATADLSHSQPATRKPTQPREQHG
jgi:DNA-binding MarR family transcriptional regulator